MLWSSHIQIFQIDTKCLFLTFFKLENQKIITSGEFWTPEGSHRYNCCLEMKVLAFLGGGSTNIRSRWILNKNIFSLTHEWREPLSNHKGSDVKRCHSRFSCSELGWWGGSFSSNVPPPWPCYILSLSPIKVKWAPFLGMGRYRTYKIPVQILCYPTDLAIDTTWYEWHCLGPACRFMRLLNISSSCHGNTACYLAHLWRLRYEHQRYLQHVQKWKSCRRVSNLGENLHPKHKQYISLNLFRPDSSYTTHVATHSFLATKPVPNLLPVGSQPAKDTLSKR